MIHTPHAQTAPNKSITPYVQGKQDERYGVQNFLGLSTIGLARGTENVGQDGRIGRICG